MNRTMKMIILIAATLVVVCLIGYACSDMMHSASQLMQSGQTAVNRSVEEAASKGADYTQTVVEQRDRYTDVSTAKNATVMVYMCGADLESEQASGTADLSEMLHASLGSDINVIVETGGASRWQNSVVDADTDTIWKLTDGGMQRLKDVGQKDMTRGSTLAEFLQYGKANYSSDRNILILWDHGGGSVGGYGYDENFPYSKAMSVDTIGSTIKDSGMKFDFVGFDACLMASIEDAQVLEPSADYLIASEIPEPGNGWYYTNWLTALSKDPSISTEELGKQIVNDFIEYSGNARYSESQTLSVIDLTKLPGVLTALDTFSTAASGQLADGDYNTVSKAREDCTSRSSSSDYGMVDLVALAAKLNNEGSTALRSAVDDAVVYSKTAYAGNDMHGLTIAFPYSDLSSYPDLTSLYSSIGFSKSYAGFLSGFESVRSSGQSIGTLNGQSTDLSSLPWFQSWLSDQYSDNGAYSDTQQTLSSELPITEKGDGYVLQLTDKQWDSIADIQLTVFASTKTGYLDMGSDEMYEFDDDGDLKIDFDGTWVALNGQPVEFYSENYTDNDDGTWVSSGYVPALVNGKDAQIVIQWDEKHTGGYVTGYRNSYSTGVAQKGVTSFKNGDVIGYMFDSYDANGDYMGTDTLGDQVTYNGDLAVSYEYLDGKEAIVQYVLTDVYGNQYLTEPVSYS